jgi:hypothetical protein
MANDTGSIEDKIQANEFEPETSAPDVYGSPGFSDEALVLRCKLLKNQAIESRRKYDWEWLVRNLYFRGYHFARYNRGTNTVVFSTRTGVRIPVNLVAAHMRGVRNQVTSFQPKWEILPSVTTESAMENARYSGKVLDYVYDKAQIKRKIKEIVNDSLWSSIGIWMFDMDKDKNVIINRVDPYDFYVDPYIKSPNLNDPEYGAEFCIRTIQMSVDSIRKNKEYENTENLHADGIIASAEYKRFLMQVTRNQYTSVKQGNPTVILNEAYLRERQPNGKMQIRLIHYVDTIQKPLKNQLLDTDEYPFEVMQGDITPGELYGESWMKHLIPINRVIDALESHIFEYNHFFARGRYVIDKNSGVRIIVNVHGQIIEKNRGSNVQPLPIAPLPPTPENQITRMLTRLEDVSGVHDVSLGRLPGTIRSGVAVAELRQADATNQSDLVDNLEDFLSRSGRRILRLVAENWNTTKLISVTSLGGKPDYFMAVGESSATAAAKKLKKAGSKKNTYIFGEMELPLAIIGADNEVKVQVGSWLAYTKEARQEQLKELFRLGAIDQQTYLSYAEFADIDGIMQRTREEALLQASRNVPNRQVEGKYGVQISDEELAMAENELMLEGQEQPVHPQDNHEVHLTIHSKYEKNDIVRAHMNEHIMEMQWLQQMQSTAQPGQGGPQQGGGQPQPGQPAPAGPGNTVAAPAQVGPGARPFNPGQPVAMGGAETPGLQPVNPS